MWGKMIVNLKFKVKNVGFVDWKNKTFTFAHFFQTNLSLLLRQTDEQVALISAEEPSSQTKSEHKSNSGPNKRGDETGTNTYKVF